MMSNARQRNVNLFPGESQKRCGMFGKGCNNFSNGFALLTEKERGNEKVAVINIQVE